MALRRRLRFWMRVGATAMPRITNAALGTWPPALVLVVGLLGAGAAKVITEAGSPWPLWIALGTVFVALSEAAFQEWTRWAPHDPLNVELSFSGQPQSLALVIKNLDVPGYLRLSLTDARWGDADAGSGLPWLLLWDTSNTERHVLHGESARIVLVSLDPNAVREIAGGQPHRPAFTFRTSGGHASVSGGGQASVSGLDRAGPFQIRIAFSLFRVDPPTSGIERSLLITFPNLSADARADWLQVPALTL
jgi:hypothetical protein